MVLLNEVVPQLEAEVEKQNMTSPDEAKALLPKSLLGLLPVPPAFVMRGMRYSEATHGACERCVIACLAHGPAAALWEALDGERDEDEEDDKEGEGQDAKKA